MRFNTSFSAFLLIPALATIASAQTSSTPAVHHTTTHSTAAHRARPVAACAAGEAAPVTPAGLPLAAGPVKNVYALRYVDIKQGTGEDAPASGPIQVHYTGWLASNGTKFDSSLDRGEPISFPVGGHRVIPGWDTGFAGMKVGGKRRLFIPYQLAYGEQGRPPVIPARADLIFDVELVGIGAPPPLPPAPPAPAAAPAASSSSAAPAPEASKSPAAPTAGSDKPAETQK